MIKRIFKLIVFIPALVIITPLEASFEVIKWVITGHAFDREPLIEKIVNW